MKTKLQAGAELDLISKDEMRDVLKSVTKDWFNQVARGDRFPRFSGSGTIVGGALRIDGASHDNQRLGPAEGFVWAVQRLGVYGLTTATGTPLAATTEPVRLYVNDDGPSSLVTPQLEGYADFGQHALVLYPGDTLLVVGESLTSSGQVTLTGQAREVPMPLAWTLGG